MSRRRTDTSALLPPHHWPANPLWTAPPHDHGGGCSISATTLGSTRETTGVHLAVKIGGHSGIGGAFSSKKSRDRIVICCADIEPLRSSRLTSAAAASLESSAREDGRSEDELEGVQ
jgi:hypothetical protein